MASARLTLRVKVVSVELRESRAGKEYWAIAFKAYAQPMLKLFHGNFPEGMNDYLLERKESFMRACGTKRMETSKGKYLYITVRYREDAWFAAWEVVGYHSVKEVAADA